MRWWMGITIGARLMRHCHFDKYICQFGEIYLGFWRWPRVWRISRVCRPMAEVGQDAAAAACCSSQSCKMALKIRRRKYMHCHWGGKLVSLFAQRQFFHLLHFSSLAVQCSWGLSAPARDRLLHSESLAQEIANLGKTNFWRRKFF